MKRFNKTLICILLVALMLCVLASCDDKPQPKTLSDVIPELGEHEVAVIIQNGEGDYAVYVVDLVEDMDATSSSLCSVLLTYLQNNKELYIDWSLSEYGRFINAIGGITPDTSKNEYVEVFTSNPDYQGTWAGVSTIEAGDITLKSASVGVSIMHVRFGDVIYFELSSY
ncbi:MAG: hypothetical protein J1F66_01490 [Clostridiales bacterium]|nr:hypothetical protein [Clostridiales bacterium]